jgi:hypothetical protein
MLPSVADRHLWPLEILSSATDQGFVIDEEALDGRWKGTASIVAKV